MNSPFEVKWLCRVEEWLASCKSFDSDQEKQILSEFRRIVDAAPEPLGHSLDLSENRVRFNLLLKQSAFESAVRTCVGHQKAFMVSGNSNGKFMASILLHGMMEEAHFEASSEAIAFAGALAKAMKMILTVHPSRGVPSLRLVAD